MCRTTAILHPLPLLCHMCRTTAVQVQFWGTCAHSGGVGWRRATLFNRSESAQKLCHALKTRNVANSNKHLLSVTEQTFSPQFPFMSADLESRLRVEIFYIVLVIYANVV